jgi:hypothetical protein
MNITMCEKEYYFKLKNNNVCVLFQQQIPNWKSLFKNSILSGSSLGAHWELSGSSLQLQVYFWIVVGTLLLSGSAQSSLQMVLADVDLFLPV